MIRSTSKLREGHFVHVADEWGKVLAVKGGRALVQLCHGSQDAQWCPTSNIRTHFEYEGPPNRALCVDPEQNIALSGANMRLMAQQVVQLQGQTLTSQSAVGNLVCTNLLLLKAPQVQLGDGQVQLQVGPHRCTLKGNLEVRPFSSIIVPSVNATPLQSFQFMPDGSVNVLHLKTNTEIEAKDVLVGEERTSLLQRIESLERQVAELQGKPGTSSAE